MEDEGGDTMRLGRIMTSLTVLMLVLGLFGGAEPVQSTGAGTSHLRLLASPVRTEERTWVRHFKHGDYGRWRKHYHYSRSFKRHYLRAARRAWNAREARRVRQLHRTAARRAYVARPFRPKRTWRTWLDHDTCGSPLINAPDCTWRGGPDLTTRYWEKRRHAQDVWTLRVIYCGAVGVAAFYTGGVGLVAAARLGAVLGGGSGLCFAGFFVK